MYIYFCNNMLKLLQCFLPVSSTCTLYVIKIKLKTQFLDWSSSSLYSPHPMHAHIHQLIGGVWDLKKDMCACVRAHTPCACTRVHKFKPKCIYTVICVVWHTQKEVHTYYQHMQRMCMCVCFFGNLWVHQGITKNVKNVKFIIFCLLNLLLHVYNSCDALK